MLPITSASAHTLVANKEAARQDAQMLLGRLKLPAGARKLASNSWVAADEAHAQERRRVSGSVAAVLDFIRHHRPYGAIAADIGTSRQNGTVTQAELGYDWAGVPGVLYQRALQVVLKPLPNGSTSVRADVAVQWFVPRPADERVLAGANLLRINRGSSPVLTTTSRAKVQRIASMFDRLQILRPGLVVSCYAADPGSTLTFTFYAHRGGPLLARAQMPASGPDGPCGPIIFSVPGHRAEALDASPWFLRRAGSALGVRLAS